MLDTHCEKNLIINNRELHYKGIFRADELFTIINKALLAKGYERREKKTEEIVAEGGKKTYIELRPFKEKANYATLMIKLKITLDNITDKVETVHGEKRKFQNGDVTIVFDAWSLSDYEARWNMKPYVFFLKAIINKFFYTFPMERGFTGELVRDTAYIYAQIRTLLNAYVPKEGKKVREEDVKMMIEKEIAGESKA